MNPSCNIDNIIGSYILGQPADNYNGIMSKDERLEVAWYLSELSNGLFGWYPFDKNGKILQVGSWFGAFTEMLSFCCKQITIVEHDPYRAFMTEKRCGAIENLTVINQSIIDYCAECHDNFDYVLFAVDENLNRIPDVNGYTEIVNAIKGVLSHTGTILLALPNRFGVKYFCGVPDPCTGRPFDGMTEHNSGFYRFDRKELLEWGESLGFPHVKLYYPMPDHHHVQMIYTDEMRPGADVLERLHIYSTHKEQRLLDEWTLTGRLAENEVMHCFSNSFLMELGRSACSGVIYSALSAERDRSRAFATNIYENGTVEKIPLYPDGEAGIGKLFNHTKELSERGIPVLPMKEINGKAVMERVSYPSLSVYLREIASKDRNGFLECMDQLWCHIKNSSEHGEADENCMRKLAPEMDWGVILKKAYIEMIPVNSFYNHGTIIFYDQEFTKDNCPAGYVMFRALKDIYTFSPDTEKAVPLNFMKERYGLVSTWELYIREEERFQTELRRRTVYSGFFYWVKHLFGTVQKNRHYLQTADKEKQTDYFNLFSNLDGRRIILFGSGKMAEHYLHRYGAEYPPIFLIDNNKGKWEGQAHGIKIKSPDTILKLMDGTYRVIITVKDYEPIVNQLDQMGINKESCRIYDREMDSLAGGKLMEPVTDGKYNIGYAAGVFDQFGLEHVLWLEKCKKQSHYLIIGVYTDEMLAVKGEKKPETSFKDRIALVRQCRYVDRVIPIDRHNSNEIHVWSEVRFGCLFMEKKDRKQNPYLWLGRKLISLGAQLEWI